MITNKEHIICSTINIQEQFLMEKNFGVKMVVETLYIDPRIALRNPTA